MQPATGINNGIVSFVASTQGSWNVMSMTTITGEPLAFAPKIEIIKGELPTSINQKPDWILRAFISNLRYTASLKRFRLSSEVIK